MTIEDLYDLALKSRTNEHIMLNIGVVGKELAANIFVETGVDILGFLISADNYGIRHAIERHGDERKESNLGQIAVQKSDFDLLLLILTEADAIIFDPRQRSPQSPIVDTIIFEKRIGDYYYVLKEIRRVRKKGKSNRLVFQTMFITKKRRTF